MALIERKACPLCNHTKLETLFSIPFTTPFIYNSLRERGEDITAEDLSSGTYELAKCENCYFVFQPYYPDDNLSAKLYRNEGSLGSLNRKLKGSLDYYAHEALLVQKMSILTGKRPGDMEVLEFGSGWGTFLKMASAYGFGVTGVEIHPERVAYARKNGFTIYEDLNDIQNKKFDFIHSDQTFEHTNDPLPLLKELVIKLKDDGLIYVGTPNCGPVWHNLKKLEHEVVMEVYPLGHINCFTNKTLISLAEKAGLKPLSPFKIFWLLLQTVRLSRNANFIQEAFKAILNQRTKTGIYFRKI